MAKLLTTELFDSFLVEEVTIDTFNTFTIDGRIHKEFYKDSEEAKEALNNEFSNWAKIRPIALSLIKGKQTPLGFKFILHLSDSDKLALLSDADMDISPDQISLGINLRFSQGEVMKIRSVKSRYRKLASQSYQYKEYQCYQQSRSDLFNPERITYRLEH